MHIKSILAAAALVAVASTSFAATGTATFVDSVANYVNPEGFSGGAVNDTITFSGLQDGLYNISLVFGGQGLSLTDLTLNGVEASSITNVGAGKTKYSFAYLDTSDYSPFTVNIVGNGVSGVLGSYSGTVTAIAAVPEPEAYALSLAGLGILGFVARRRKAVKQA